MDSNVVPATASQGGPVSSTTSLPVRTSVAAEVVNERFGDRLEEALTDQNVRHIFRRPLYRGKVSIDPNPPYQDSQTITDDSLQIVQEETYEEAQSVIETISERHSTAGKNLDLDNSIDEFGLFPVFKASPIVKLLCGECGGDYRLNGQRGLHGDYTGHNLECKECGRQRKFPYERELKEMKEIPSR
jgi:hypothetical protein